MTMLLAALVPGIILGAIFACRNPDDEDLGLGRLAWSFFAIAVGAAAIGGFIALQLPEPTRIIVGYMALASVVATVLRTIST